MTTTGKQEPDSVRRWRWRVYVTFYIWFALFVAMGYYTNHRKLDVVGSILGFAQILAGLAFLFSFQMKRRAVRRFKANSSLSN